MSVLNDLKHSIRDLYRYPHMQKLDAAYDAYWHARDMSALNAFQAARVKLLSYEISSDQSVMDVGCGTGVILSELKKRGHRGMLNGVDSSSEALAHAKQFDIDVHRGNILDVTMRAALPVTDIIMFLEVLEHMAQPEDILAWAVSHARSKVIFSVPNTGYIFHRLRLLFGRFPLQWKSHPSEHVRFWTVRDMKWWLSSLGYANATVRVYKGIPFLNSLFPSLFGQGMFVVIFRE